MSCHDSFSTLNKIENIKEFIFNWNGVCVSECMLRGVITGYCEWAAWNTIHSFAMCNRIDLFSFFGISNWRSKRVMILLKICCFACGPLASGMRHNALAYTPIFSLGAAADDDDIQKELQCALRRLSRCNLWSVVVMDFIVLHKFYCAKEDTLNANFAVIAHDKTAEAKTHTQKKKWIFMNFNCAKWPTSPYRPLTRMELVFSHKIIIERIVGMLLFFLFNFSHLTHWPNVCKLQAIRMRWRFVYAHVIRALISGGSSATFAMR